MRTYRTGKISLTTGSLAVVGVGTQFLTNVNVGDIIVSESGQAFEVVTVTTNTALTVDVAAKMTGQYDYAALHFVTPVNFSDLSSGIERFLADRQKNLGEFNDWQTGSATGGPASNGMYPITDRYGVVRFFPCPDLMSEGGAAAAAAAQAAAASATAAAATANEMLDELEQVVANSEPKITPGLETQFWSGTKVWTDLASSVRDAVMTGLSVSTNAAVVAADSLLAAMGKLQAQITSLGSTKENNLPTGGATTHFLSGVKTWRTLQTDVRATVLTGLSTATSTVVAATDTMLVAFGKLQAQVTLRALKGANSDITSLTGLTTPLSVAQGGTGKNTALTPADIGAVPSSALGATVATLVGGTVPAGQLPSYVDDVLEFANLAGFPATGESGKIYVALDSNAQYRWTGSTYTMLVASPGTTDNVPEGSTNRYWTAARTLATALAGLVTDSPVVIAATDTVLGAIGKLQAQISLRAPIDSPTFTGVPLMPTAALGTSTQQAANMAALAAAFAAAGIGGKGAEIIDANATLPTGFYNLTTPANGGLNGPTQIASIAWGILNLGSSIASDPTAQIFQLAWPRTTASTNKYRFFHRQNYNGTWSAWKESADTDSPTFTGTPTVPTAAVGTNSLVAASTAFVQALMVQAGFMTTAVAATADLNTMTVGQLGRYTNTSTNVPVAAQSGMVLHAAYSTTYWAQLGMHIGQSSANPKLMYRVMANSVIQAWREVAFLDGATFTGPIRHGQYTLSTLPSASAFNGHIIDVTDATGGPKVCRSNGTVWQIINTTTTVS